MRKTIFVTTVIALALAGPAHAQQPTSAATLTPNTPAVGSILHFALTGPPATPAGAIPDSLEIDLQRGFTLDPLAVAVRCDASHVTTGDCPAASRIGSGHAVVHASGLIVEDFPVTIDVFLADPVAPTDLASVVLRVTVAGKVRGVRARLFALPSGAFGYELLTTGFASFVPTFPGVAFALTSLTLDLGAHRTITTTVVKRKRVTRKGKRVTVRRKVTRRVRHDLVRNPPACAGGWAARATTTVGGVPSPQAITIPCAAA